MTPLNLEALTSLVLDGAVAIRVRQRLQPAGGAGDKIFSPTYADESIARTYLRGESAAAPLKPGRCGTLTWHLRASSSTSARLRRSRAAAAPLKRRPTTSTAGTANAAPYDLHSRHR
jgi:hypothetical protein